MSQYGAYGYAKYGHKSYDFIIKHYYTGVTLGKVGNPLIRVQLRRGLSSASVTDAARYSATWGSKTVKIAGGTTAVVSWSNGSYHLKAGSRSWSPASPITFVAGSAKLKLLTANANGYVGRYRGKLRLLHLTDGLMVVNTLPLERYLFGVVPRESPASWPAEALKAQAVAARSYAYRAIGSSGPFDVYCTTASQMYGGADGEVSSTNKAVTATRGIVPKYSGKPITAYFFSTSGGHTENIEDVWTSASPVAYLKGVTDPYDYASPYHAWPDNPSRRTPAALKSAFGFTNGLLRGVYVVKRGTSPRVVRALLIGSTGTATIDGASIRADLGLRDTWAYFTSISISPSTSTRRTITYGTTTTVTGRRYPRLASGLSFTLHHRKLGGTWASGSLAATAGSRSLAGYTVKFSSFSATVKPLANSEYYVSSPAAIKPGKALSPHTTIYVRPAATLKASATAVAIGDTVTFTGTVKPATQDKVVWLQTRTTSGWSDAVSGKLAADGTFSIDWDAVSDATDLRLRVPKSSTLVEGTSAAVTVTGS